MRQSDNASGQKETKSAPRTTRLIFTYEGDRIELVSSETVEMVPPLSDVLEPRTKESGFWYELRNAKDTILFRRIIQNPIRYYAEVRSENPDRPFTWKKVDRPSGTFILLVPEIKEARSISLYSSPPGIGVREQAREVARFPIKTGKKRKGE